MQFAGFGSDSRSVSFTDTLHQCLFLEDMVKTVFSEPVPEMDENGLVTSAVLQRPRGYDKSFHSAFVSFAILQFYRGLGENQNDAPSIAALQNTLGELIEKRTFLTPNGVAVLDQLKADLGAFVHGNAVSTGTACFPSRALRPSVVTSRSSPSMSGPWHKPHQ